MSEQTIGTQSVPDVAKDTYTYDEAIDKLGFGWYQILMLQLCGFGMIFEGIELTMLPFIIPQLMIEWSFSPVLAGVMAGVVFIGMALGAYVGGIISDRFSRKLVFASSVFVVSLFGLASAYANRYWLFLVLRIFMGIGLGASLPTDHSMMMEITPARLRVLHTYFVVGTTFECVLAYLCLTEGNFHVGQGWRYLIIFSTMPGFFLFVARLFAPESPRFLLGHGRLNEVESILKSIARWNGQSVPDGVLVAPHTEEPLSIFAQIKGMFSLEYLRQTLVLLIIWFAVSFTSVGYNFLFPIVYHNLGIFNPYTASLIANACRLGACFLALLIIDFVPRRVFLCITLIIAGIAVSIFAVYRAAAYMIIMSCFVSFGMYFPWMLLYLYTAESFPTVFRATAVGACTAVTRVAGAITPVIGEAMLTQSYVLPFVIYGVVLAVAGLLAPFLPIETLGKNLKDVSDKQGVVEVQTIEETDELRVPLTAAVPDHEEDEL